MKTLLVALLAVTAVVACDDGATVCGDAGLCCPSQPFDMACSACTGVECVFSGPDGVGNRCCPHSGTAICSGNGECMPGFTNPAIGRCNCTSKPYSGVACDTFGANLTAITDEHCHQLSIGDNACSKLFWANKGYQFASYTYNSNLPCPPRFGFQEKKTVVCDGPGGAVITVWGLGGDEEEQRGEEKHEDSPVVDTDAEDDGYTLITENDGMNPCRVPWSGPLCSVWGGVFHSVSGEHCWQLDIKNTSCAHSYFEAHGYQFKGFDSDPCPSKYNDVQGKTPMCIVDDVPSVVTTQLGMKATDDMNPCRVPWSGPLCSVWGGVFHSVSGEHCWQLDIKNTSCAHSYFEAHGYQFKGFDSDPCPSKYNDVQGKTPMCIVDDVPSVVTTQLGMKA